MGLMDKSQVPSPGPHPQVTHLGARVAPQRCPILRVSAVSIFTRPGSLVAIFTGDKMTVGLNPENQDELELVNSVKQKFQFRLKHNI